MTETPEDRLAVAIADARTVLKMFGDSLAAHASESPALDDAGLYTVAALERQIGEIERLVQEMVLESERTVVLGDEGPSERGEPDA